MQDYFLPAIALFTSSIAVTMMLGSSRRHAIRKLSTLHATYEETLKKMFPIDLDKKKVSFFIRCSSKNLTLTSSLTSTASISS
jgi:hypothetical protein